MSWQPNSDAPSPDRCLHISSPIFRISVQLASAGVLVRQSGIAVCIYQLAFGNPTDRGNCASSGFLVYIARWLYIARLSGPTRSFPDHFTLRDRKRER